MLVRCISNEKHNGDKHDLTVGKIYMLLGINFTGRSDRRHFSVQSDSDGYPCLFDFSLFEMVDSRVPDTWCLTHLDSSYYGENSFRLWPKEFAAYEDFWDKFHDDDKDAMKIFMQVLKKMAEFHGLEQAN